MLEDIDRLELYDFRFGSGVVLLDEGVALFRGIKDGDCAHDRGREDMGSAWVGGVYGIGGTAVTTDALSIRRASVGLMVRAPSPVACGGTTDILLDDEEGVVAPDVAFLTGDRAALVEEDRAWSAFSDAVKELSLCAFGVGCIDFAFRARGLSDIFP